MRILLRIFRLARRYSWAIALAYVGLVGTAALSLLVPRVLEDVIDIGINSGDSSFMLHAGLLVVGLGVLRGATGFATRYFAEWLANRVVFEILSEGSRADQKRPFRTRIRKTQAKNPASDDYRDGSARTQFKEPESHPPQKPARCADGRFRIRQIDPGI